VTAATVETETRAADTAAALADADVTAEDTSTDTEPGQQLAAPITNQSVSTSLATLERIARNAC
jgi:hypothetical protein